MREMWYNPIPSACQEAHLVPLPCDVHIDGSSGHACVTQCLLADNNYQVEFQKHFYQIKFPSFEVMRQLGILNPLGSFSLSTSVSSQKSSTYFLYYFRFQDTLKKVEFCFLIFQVGKSSSSPPECTNFMKASLEGFSMFPIEDEKLCSLLLNNNFMFSFNAPRGQKEQLRLYSDFQSSLPLLSVGIRACLDCQGSAKTVGGQDDLCQVDTVGRGVTPVNKLTEIFDQETDPL